MHSMLLPLCLQPSNQTMGVNFQSISRRKPLKWEWSIGTAESERQPTMRIWNDSTGPYRMSVCAIFHEDFPSIKKKYRSLSGTTIMNVPICHWGCKHRWKCCEAIELYTVLKLV